VIVTVVKAVLAQQERIKSFCLDQDGAIFSC
jgi:hypothetical protein